MEKVINPKTRRLVSVGGKVFNNLVEKGYIYDEDHRSLRLRIDISYKICHRILGLPETLSVVAGFLGMDLIALAGTCRDLNLLISENHIDEIVRSWVRSAYYQAEEISFDEPEDLLNEFRRPYQISTPVTCDRVFKHELILVEDMGIPLTRDAVIQSHLRDAILSDNIPVARHLFLLGAIYSISLCAISFKTFKLLEEYRTERTDVTELASSYLTHDIKVREKSKIIAYLLEEGADPMKLIPRTDSLLIMKLLMGYWTRTPEDAMTKWLYNRIEPLNLDRSLEKALGSKIGRYFVSLGVKQEFIKIRLSKVYNSDVTRAFLIFGLMNLNQS